MSPRLTNVCFINIMCLSSTVKCLKTTRRSFYVILGFVLKVSLSVSNEVQTREKLLSPFTRAFELQSQSIH